jgi:5-(carboxyamino)imidazole ribonucleotide mutase
MEKLVPLLLGSESDQEWAKKITDGLDSWGIPFEVKVVSAHKVPEKLIELVEKYNQFEGDLCYVTIAGRSNGLSGCTAGSSVHPVVACPPFADKDDMMVNINSTLQMPSDTPVMTVLDPKNAVLAVVRIFALNDPELKQKYTEHIKKVKSSFNVS